MSRHFTHHGVQHVPGDALTAPRELAAWMSQRGLVVVGARITPAMFDAALQLRKGVRAYLACDPTERRKNKDAIRSLNSALRTFPLVVEAWNERDMALVAAGSDPGRAVGDSGRALPWFGQWNSGSAKDVCGRESGAGVLRRSKPATRRWCMSTLCGNRMKTRHLPRAPSPRLLNAEAPQDSAG